MPEVGEVVYKSRVDTSNVDKDIDETEEKLKKAGKEGEEAFKGIGDQASGAGEKIRKLSKQTQDGLDESAKRAVRFSDALGKIPDGPIGKLTSSIGESKEALDGVNNALEKMPNSIGLAVEKYRLTKEEIQSTKEKLEELKKVQEEAKESLKAGDISKSQYRAISREVLKTQADLKELKSEGKSAFKELANTGAAVTGIKKIGDAAKSVGSVGLKAIKGIGTGFIGLISAAGAGVVAVGKMGIEYNAQMQSYQTAFATMLGDAEKAQQLTDNLKNLAASTPLAMTDLADASQILLAFGSSAEEIPDQLKRLGDVALGDAEALGTMATAFGRVQSNGYASLEEINMMIDQGFNPLQIIAEQTGETMAEVRDRVSEGGVSFEELSNALQIATDEGGQFFNAMENQSQTFDGQISTLKDNVAMMTGEMTAQLFDNLANNALPMINGWVDQVSQAVETGGVEGGVNAMGVVLTEALTALLSAAPSVVDTAISLVGSFLQGIRDMGPEITDGAVSVIMVLIDGFVDMVPDIISTAGTLISSLISGIADHFPQILQSGIQLVKNLISGLFQALPEILSAVGQLAISMVQAFFDTDWIEVGRDIIRGIVDGIGSLGSMIKNKLTSLAKSAWNGIKSFFGISSPSKLMRDTVGKPIVQGMEVGMDDETDEAVRTARRSSSAIVSALTADVNYNMPDISSYTQRLSAGLTASVGGTTITVPVVLDGREIARASAWWTGEQLSWEEM